MFIATHSPFIIHNPNRYNDKVVILSKKDTIKPNDFPQEEFYKETRKKDKYGAISVFKNLDKTKLCEYICTNDIQRYLIRLDTIISKIINDKNGG